MAKKKETKKATTKAKAEKKEAPKKEAPKKVEAVEESAVIEGSLGNKTINLNLRKKDTKLKLMSYRSNIYRYESEDRKIVLTILK